MKKWIAERRKELENMRGALGDERCSGGIDILNRLSSNLDADKSLDPVFCLSLVHHHYCSCGGGGAKNGCSVCKMYHHFKDSWEGE